MAKQIEIEPPKGYTFKEVKDGKIICEEKVKKLTYEDVAKELFYDRFTFFTEASGEINSDTIKGRYADPNNATTKRQLEKLLAINKLMNVAKYLNGDWQPNWNDDSEFKYSIYYSNQYKILDIEYTIHIQYNSIFFKSKELASQAIEILGEETVRLALSTEY